MYGFSFFLFVLCVFDAVLPVFGSQRHGKKAFNVKRLSPGSVDVKELLVNELHVFFRTLASVDFEERASLDNPLALKQLHMKRSSAVTSVIKTFIRALFEDPTDVLIINELEKMSFAFFSGLAYDAYLAGKFDHIFTEGNGNQQQQQQYAPFDFDGFLKVYNLSVTKIGSKKLKIEARACLTNHILWFAKTLTPLRDHFVAWFDDFEVEELPVLIGILRDFRTRCPDDSDKYSLDFVLVEMIVTGKLRAFNTPPLDLLDHVYRGSRFLMTALQYAEILRTKQSPTTFMAQQRLSANLKGKFFLMVKDGLLIAHPDTGALLFSKTLSDGDVKRIGFALKMALKNNIHVPRLALTVEEYERANQYFMDDLVAFPGDLMADVAKEEPHSLDSSKFDHVPLETCFMASPAIPLQLKSTLEKDPQASDIFAFHTVGISYTGDIDFSRKLLLSSGEAASDQPKLMITHFKDGKCHLSYRNLPTDCGELLRNPYTVKARDCVNGVLDRIVVFDDPDFAEAMESVLAGWTGSAIPKTLTESEARDMDAEEERETRPYRLDGETIVFKPSRAYNCESLVDAARIIIVDASSTSTQQEQEQAERDYFEERMVLRSAIDRLVREDHLLLHPHKYAYLLNRDIVEDTAKLWMVTKLFTLSMKMGVKVPPLCLQEEDYMSMQSFYSSDIIWVCKYSPLFVDSIKQAVKDPKRFFKYTPKGRKFLDAGLPELILQVLREEEECYAHLYRHISRNEDECDIEGIEVIVEAGKEEDKGIVSVKKCGKKVSISFGEFRSKEQVKEAILGLELKTIDSRLADPINGDDDDDMDIYEYTYFSVGKARE